MPLAEVDARKPEPYQRSIASATRLLVSLVQVGEQRVAGLSDDSGHLCGQKITSHFDFFHFSRPLPTGPKERFGNELDSENGRVSSLTPLSLQCYFYLF